MHRNCRVIGLLVATWMLVGCSNSELESDVGRTASQLSTVDHGPAVMLVVAHEDDDILFMSPDLLRDVRAGRPIFTVYVTAGDAGLDTDYWLGREAGARAAYASMAGVGNDWNEYTLSISDYDIAVFALNGGPDIQLAFLRLPDGCGGPGCVTPGQSIASLWQGDVEVATLDGTATYTRASLIGALTELMEFVAPSQLRIQNHVDPAGDHPDHHHAALFAHEARQQLASPPELFAYIGYLTSQLPANVSGEELNAKQRAFDAYAQFDPLVCNNADCRFGILADYERWLARQYTVASPSAPIRVQGLDKCLDVRGPSTANGTVVQIWDCVGVANQDFVFSEAGELRGYANKCVDVRGPSADNGTAVQMWDCVGVANQSWELTDDGHIRGYAGKCLQVRAASDGTVDFANGTPVEMWDCADIPEQRWSL